MLPTTLRFPIDKRVTEHCSILVPESVGLDHKLNASCQETPK